MPEFVDGLPLHPLLVHFVVVLLPLAAAGAVVISVWPAARQRFGWLVVAATAGAVLLIPFTTHAGAQLKARLPDNAQINRHEELGNLMLRLSIPLLVFVVALMVVHELSQRREIPWAKLAMVVLAVLTIGSAVLAGVHVFRTGEAGSRSVYPDVPSLTK
jgi:uncharacterized membrane protein